MAEEIMETTDAAFLGELGAICTRRAATYNLLARLYRKEVDQELLTELCGMRFPASTGSAKTDEGYRLLAGYLGKVWDNTLLELAKDYVNVFVGVTNQADGAAFPFESVYTSEHRLLMQEARDEVLAIYRAYGLDKTSDWREGEDHIALELEFMGVLCSRAAEELAKGQLEAATQTFATQKNFMFDHLGAWAPMLTSDMRHFAKTDFYRGLAAITDGYLETEVVFLAEIVEE